MTSRNEFLMNSTKAIYRGLNVEIFPLFEVLKGAVLNIENEPCSEN